MIIFWDIYVGIYFIHWKNNKDFEELEDHHHYTDELIAMNILKLLNLMVAMFKLVGCCRVFVGFASLIMMIRTVLYDLTDFIILFFGLVIWFALLQNS